MAPQQKGIVKVVIHVGIGGKIVVYGEIRSAFPKKKVNDSYVSFEILDRDMKIPDLVLI